MVMSIMSHYFVDHETDRNIQKTLRAELGNDTTMITIAHRLQTIMDYDMIVCVHVSMLSLSLMRKLPCD